MVKGRVLLAHGNADCRKIYGSVLSHEGYDVDVVADIDAALRHGPALPYDLIVTDLYLPSADEDECLLRRVRLEPFTAHIPVVVITGWTTEPHRQLAMSEKADAFLPLPIRPRELVRIIGDLLDVPQAASTPLRPAADTPGHSIANGL
jgi:chemosensory pili system protein ChpA (sensor histidine kinase/response regulator)